MGELESQRTGPDGKPVSLVDSVEEAFLAELSFECDWLLAAWNLLVKGVSEGDAVFGARPLELSLSRWSSVDQILLHIVRIDRILNPRPGWDSEDSFDVRCEVARRISQRPGLALSQPTEITKVRNWVEHANEYLPDFFKMHPKKALGPVAVGPDAGLSGKLNYVSFRTLDTETWQCAVLGETVNLKSLVESVQALRFALPRPGVTPHLIPREIPPST